MSLTPDRRTVRSSTGNTPQQHISAAPVNFNYIPISNMDFDGDTLQIRNWRDVWLEIDKKAQKEGRLTPARSVDEMLDSDEDSNGESDGESSLELD